MKYIKHSLIILILALFICCEDDDFDNDFFEENLASIPINFPGSILAADAPTYTFAYNASTNIDITIPMEIPSSSGRTISQISRVAAGNTAINPGSLSDNYISSPISAGSNSVVFQTTTDEFSSLRTDSVEPGSTIAFIFEIVLDDGQILISREIEVDLVE
ncbi:MAG: hypothetical protein AAGC64_02540 [Bacteroidota bacterium]